MHNARSVELGREECLELLAAGVVGRVVYTDAALPAAHPVGYVLLGDEVMFRTEEEGRLADATRHAVVGFQADQIDGGTGAGWTVLGIGETREVTDDEHLGAMDRQWRSGAGTRTVALPLHRLTGSRFDPLSG
jgi:uncharacterized protein